MKLIDGSDSNGKKHAEQSASAASYFDINQLELAVINSLLESSSNIQLTVINFAGLPERTLHVQKTNLEKLLRRLNREHNPKSLKSELGKIISGEKSLPIRCFPTLKPSLIKFNFDS